MATSPYILWATGSPRRRLLLSSMSSSSRLGEGVEGEVEG